MKCNCGKDITEYEKKKYNKCSICYSKDWSKNIEGQKTTEEKIRQTKNIIKCYEDMKEKYCEDCYDDAIKSYTNYLKELEV